MSQFCIACQGVKCKHVPYVPAEAERSSASKRGAHPLESLQQGLATGCYMMGLQEAAPAAAKGCGTEEESGGAAAADEGK